MVVCTPYCTTICLPVEWKRPGRRQYLDFEPEMTCFDPDIEEIEEMK